MLNRKEIKKIISNINKEELSREITGEALDFYGIDGVVFAELNIETGDINVEFRSDSSFKPEIESGLWVAQFTTSNMDEIPDELDDEIENSDNQIKVFYSSYPSYCVEFFDEYELEEKMKELSL